MNTDKQTRWIIVTDLDGTLLDHHTYSFIPAINALNKLKQYNTPIIINSSKTAGEINGLRKQLNNQHPFVTENGSGIFVPKNYFSHKLDISEEGGHYWKVNLGRSREQLIAALKKLPAEFNQYYRSYHQSTVDDIIQMTGLSKEQAERSMRRDYTEPLQWLGNEEQRKQFYWHLYKQHIHFTEGGRFIHLMGHTNKGSATSWLAQQYEKHYGENVKVVALGDGKNDIDMLKAADIAVVVKSPINDAPIFDHPCKIITKKTGPSGWSEAIHQLFFKQAETQQ